MLQLLRNRSHHYTMSTTESGVHQSGVHQVQKIGTCSCNMSLDENGGTKRQGGELGTGASRRPLPSMLEGFISNVNMAGKPSAL